MFNWQPPCFLYTTFKGRCGYSNAVHMQRSQLQLTICMRTAYSHVHAHHTMATTQLVPYVVLHTAEQCKCNVSIAIYLP